MIAALGHCIYVYVTQIGLSGLIRTDWGRHSRRQAAERSVMISKTCTISVRNVVYVRDVRHVRPVFRFVYTYARVQTLKDRVGVASQSITRSR